MSIVYLKIKIVSLAAEARIIRREEAKTQVRWRRVTASSQWSGHENDARTLDLQAVMAGLHQHRTLEVRREARSALLAYGFLRHRAYRELEVAHGKPDASRVAELVRKYGTEFLDKERAMAAVKAWLDEDKPVKGTSHG